MGVDGGDEVEQAADYEELGAVVAKSDGDRACSQAEDAGDEVERAEAELADEAEDVEYVAGVGCVDFALQAEADEVHPKD